MKKISYLLLLLISQTGWAVGGYQSPKAMHYLTGFYFKAGIGGTIGQFDTSQTYLFDQTMIFPFTLDQSVEHQSQGTQVAGVLGFGYSYQIDALWMIGAEFTAGFTSANTSYHNYSNFDGAPILNSTVQSTLNNDFALVVKPGLAIQQRTQFYALLGARWGNFENEVSSHFEDTFFGISGDQKSSVSNYVLGFTVGIGVERLLTDHWALGLEYAYTAYGNIPSVSNDYLIELDGEFIDSVTDTLTATAAASTLLLESSYRF